MCDTVASLDVRHDPIWQAYALCPRQPNRYQRSCRRAGRPSDVVAVCRQLPDKVSEEDPGVGIEVQRPPSLIERLVLDLAE